MPDQILVSHFRRGLDRQTVLQQLSCAPGSAAQTELLASFEQLEPFFRQSVKPKAVIAFGYAPVELQNEFLKAGDAVAFVISTLGNEVERVAKEYFEQKDYFSGMVLNAMADAYLFSIEQKLLETLKTACKARGVGVESRLEAPLHLPMEAQIIAVRETDAEKLLGISVTEGLMLYPVKSCCFVAKLTPDSSVFCAAHDCGGCPNLSCSLRNPVCEEGPQALTRRRC